MYMHPKKYFFVCVLKTSDMTPFLSSDSLWLIVHDIKATDLSETLFFTCDITLYKRHDNQTGFAYHKALQVLNENVVVPFAVTK